jgi:hypothetical protein
MEPPKIQSPFARCRRYLHQGDMSCLLRGRYSSVIAHTDSCVHPLRLSSPSAIRPRSSSLCRLRSAPAASGMFPTLSPGIFLRLPDPMPRRSHEVHLPVSSFVSSAFPRSRVSRLPASNPRTRLFADRLFEAADIPLCSGLRVCSPPRSFPPLLTAAGRPRLLHPGRTCFVASARTGHANRPNTGN